MATTNTYTKGVGYNDHYKLTIQVIQNSQNIANNTTNVTVKMYAKSDSSSYGAYNLSNSSPVNLTVNGTTVVSKKISMDFRNKATVNLASWTGNITHNSDGTKTLACSGSFYVSGSDYMGSNYKETLSTSTTLAAIPRQSAIASIGSASNTIGETFTLKLTVRNAAFSHKAWIKIGSTSIVGTTSIAAGSSSLNFATSSHVATWAKAIPNATSATATVYMDTYSGSTKIGSTVSKNFTVKLPSSVVPKVSVSVADKGIITGTTTYQSAYGGYVQGFSRPSVTISANTDTYGGTLKTYTLTCDGKTYKGNLSSSPVVVNCSAIKTSGNNTITVTVTDSRGRSASQTAMINVLSYALPSVTDFTIERCDSDGTANDQGSYMRVNGNCRISPLLNGDTIQNSGTLHCYYKSSLATGYSDGGTIALSGSALAQPFSLIVPSINTETSYTVYLQLTDNLVSVRTSNYDVGTAFTLLHLSDDGTSLSIGKVAELSNTFDVGLSTIFRKNVYMKNSWLHLGYETNEEKNISFENQANKLGQTYEADGVYPHNCKIYGGSSVSTMGIGAYDKKNDVAIWRYRDTDQRLFLGSRVCAQGGFEQPVLTKGTDLNNVTVPNIYSGSSSSSDYYGNCPITGGSFTLRVEAAGDSGQLKQTLTQCDKATSETWERFYYSNAWGTWIPTSRYGEILLWEGALYMNGSQSATLTRNISAMPKGIILTFCPYVDGTAQTWGFNSFFIPKEHVTKHPNGGSSFIMSVANFATIGIKYIYINDDKLSGNDANSESGTKNGITYNNKYFILRRVFGV